MFKYLRIKGVRQTKDDLMYLIGRIDSMNCCSLYRSYTYGAYVAMLRVLVEHCAIRVCCRLSIAQYRELCKSFGLTPRY